jgi:hypothetical protein
MEASCSASIVLNPLFSVSRGVGSYSASDAQRKGRTENNNKWNYSPGNQLYFFRTQLSQGNLLTIQFTDLLLLVKSDHRRKYRAKYAHRKESKKNNI